MSHTASRFRPPASRPVQPRSQSASSPFRLTKKRTQHGAAGAAGGARLPLLALIRNPRLKAKPPRARLTFLLFAAPQPAARLVWTCGGAGGAAAAGRHQAVAATSSSSLPVLGNELTSSHPPGRAARLRLRHSTSHSRRSRLVRRFLCLPHIVAFLLFSIQ